MSCKTQNWSPSAVLIVHELMRYQLMPSDRVTAAYYAGLGLRGYSAVERLHRSGLTAADMWCLDSERRNTDGSPGISFRLLQVIALFSYLPLGCQNDLLTGATRMIHMTRRLCIQCQHAQTVWGFLFLQQ